MRANIFRPGVAATVAKEAGHRRRATVFQRFTKHVLGPWLDCLVFVGSANHGRPSIAKSEISKNECRHRGERSWLLKMPGGRIDEAMLVLPLQRRTVKEH
jgi:hypothetical protein